MATRVVGFSPPLWREEEGINSRRKAHRHKRKRKVEHEDESTDEALGPDRDDSGSKRNVKPKSVSLSSRRRKKRRHSAEKAQDTQKSASRRKQRDEESRRNTHRTTATSNSSKRRRVKPTAPETIKANTNDPNYQTLKGLLNENIFKPNASGLASGGGPRPPAKAGMVQTNDPNYQTLAGINQDQIFKEKGGDGGTCGGGGFGGGGCAGAGGGGNNNREPVNKWEATPTIKIPVKAAMVGTNDPNYQTLAGLNNDVVFKDKGGGGGGAGGGAGGGGGGGGGGGAGPKRPANHKVVDTKDPNYQTLAGLNNDELFGKEKGGVVKDDKDKWATY